MKRVAVCSTAWLAWALAGCGSGDSGEAVRGSTRLRMSISWAERARSITGPSSPLSSEVIVCPVMKALGVLDGLEGKGPAAVRGVSADGQILVGSAGTAPFRGFVMTLPR